MYYLQTVKVKNYRGKTDGNPYYRLRDRKKENKIGRKREKKGISKIGKIGLCIIYRQ